MKSLAWVGYSLGLFLMASGLPKAGGILFLVAMMAHWRWWIIAAPLGIAAFIIGMNWNK